MIKFLLEAVLQLVGKILLILLCLNLQAHSFGNLNDAAKKIFSSPPSHVPFVFTFVDPKADSLEGMFMNLSSHDFAQKTYMTPLSYTDFSWSMRLNKIVIDSASSPSLPQILSWLQDMTDANLTVVQQEGSWAIYSRKDIGFTQIGLYPQEAKTSDGMMKWFLKHLGYEGVLLAYEGDYFLAGGLKPFTKDGIKGLVINNSENTDQVKIRPGKEEVNTLLELVDRDGAYAVFEVILHKRGLEMPKPGSKIVLTDSLD